MPVLPRIPFTFIPPPAAPLLLKKAPRLLVIRDEYANVMAPFLALHYSTVTLVDPTLLEGPLESLVNLDDYDQALLCYSLKHFACE